MATHLRYSLAAAGWPGQASRIHSGGHKRSTQTQFVYHAGGFRCGMCNVMLALADCPVGGGGTMLVPGSVRRSPVRPGWRLIADPRCVWSGSTRVM